LVGGLVSYLLPHLTMFAQSHRRAALASLDYFASVLAEIVRIESPVGEAKVQLKT